MLRWAHGWRRLACLLCAAVSSPCPAALAPAGQQLEKALAAARRELSALQQRQDAQAEAAARHEQKLLQQQVAALRSRLAAAEQELCTKAAALAAADKRLRHSQLILQRVASRGGSGGAPLGVGAA